MDRTVGGTCEGFLLEIKEDGNYLTVYSEDDDRALVDLASLRECLAQENVTDYDLLQVARMVRAADGVREKLEPGRADDEENKIVPFRIEIARDWMSASVRFVDAM